MNRVLHMECPDNKHIGRKVQYVCSSPQCSYKSRLLCGSCSHSEHSQFMIPLNELQESLSGQSVIEMIREGKMNWSCNFKMKEILQFIIENENVDAQSTVREIEESIVKLIDEFKQDICAKLESSKEFLIQLMISKTQQARSHYEYLRDRYQKQLNMTELANTLLKYQEGTYTLQIVNDIFKNFFMRIHNSSELLNIYQYLSQQGTNHNYLDLFHLDLKKFHAFKNKILSHFAKCEDAKYLIPEHHQSLVLPTQSHPKFTWSLMQTIDPNRTNKIHSLPVKTINSIQKLSKITALKVFEIQNSFQTTFLNQHSSLSSLLNPEEQPITSSIRKMSYEMEFDQSPINTNLNTTDKYILLVIDDSCIQLFNQAGYLKSTLHQTKHNDKYLAVEFLPTTNPLNLLQTLSPAPDLLAFTLKSSPTSVTLLNIRNAKLVRKIPLAANQPIKSLHFIRKYPLYSDKSHYSLLTLDIFGTLKLTQLFQPHLYPLTYGAAIQEIQILPDIKPALSLAQSNTEDALYDFVLCSYSKNTVKLAVRSLFSPQPIAKIYDEETIEQKLGLNDHCNVHFRIFEFSMHEKQYLKQQREISGLDYGIVTVLNEILTVWNWRSGQPIKRIDISESYGVRVFPNIQQSLMNIFILVGEKGQIHKLNWLNESIDTCKFNNLNNFSIHNMSECFSQLQNNSMRTSFLLALRDKNYPFMLFSQLNYC